MAAQTSAPDRYRWVILAAAAPILALVLGQILNGLATFIVPLETEFGWQRGDIAFINTSGLIGLAIGSAIMGYVADRYGVRRVAFLGVTVTGLCVIAASRADELWQLYAIFFVAGLLGGGSISAPLLALVGNWFVTGAGLAIGIAAASQALGQGGMPFSASILVEAFGWRGAWLAQGIVTLAVGLPLAWLLRPPPRGGPGSAALSLETPSGLPNWLITATLAAAVLFCCTTMAVPLIHLVPLIQDRGHGASDAGSVLFLMLMVAITGRVAFGRLADMIGALPSWLIASAWQTGLVFGYVLIDDLQTFYIYAAIYGFGYAGVMTSLLVSARNLIAPGRRATSMGIVLALAYVGHGIGGWQGGYFYDLTGGYTWTYANAVISGLINLTIVGTLFLVLRGRRPGAAPA